MTKKLRVALIYDWADTHYGGAEKVLLALKQLYPQAHLFTALADFQNVTWLKKFAVVHTSFLQHFPHFFRQNKALIAPLMPFAFERFDLSAYDLVISVCSFAAKGVITTPEQQHLCYLLTPTRFLFSHRQQYRSAFLNWLTQPLNRYLQKWEQAAIWRPDTLVVLSHLVARRCQRYYHRPPDAVIYPPLLEITSDQKNTPAPPKENFFLCVARLVSYKKIDLAIKSCLQLQLPLKIIGTGPELTKLQLLASSHRHGHLIEFLGNVSSKTLFDCYNKAVALIAPGEEDFGLNILEANQAHTWVIAHQNSGALELLDLRQSYPVATATQKALTQTLRIFCQTWQAQNRPTVWLRPKTINVNLKEEFFTGLQALVEDKYYESNSN